MPTIKLKDIFGRNDENKLVLPDFQRDFVWDKEQQKNLLASFITYLPVGSILLLDGTKDDFANKKICFPKESCSPKDECTYLLDGQQRITSLKSMFVDLFFELDDWTKTWENIYKDLRNRWFVRLMPKDSEEDIFGYERLSFKSLGSYEPNQVVDYIEYKTIFKTKVTDWFHPGFVVADKNGQTVSNADVNLRNYYIAEHAASEGLVPLFTLYKKDTTKALHEYVVEKIGRDRADCLKAKIQDIENADERSEEIRKYLSTIQPDIDSNDQEAINRAWYSLSAKWSRDVINYLEGILNAEVPTTELPADEINRAVAIFESINKGGTPLDTYDLIVAKAAKDKSLPALSARLLTYLQEGMPVGASRLWYSEHVGLINDNELTKIVKNQFLNILSIFSNTDYRNLADVKVDFIKRPQILQLSSEQINTNAEKAVRSLIRASAFLQLRCGICNIKEMPYELMILPIAFCLIDDEKWNDRKVINKIEYWYWSCLLGGAYRDRQNEQCIKDIKALYKWINAEIDDPFVPFCNKVLDDPGYSDEDVLLMKDETHIVQNGIRKALLQYTLSNEPNDFLYEELTLTAWRVGEQEKYEFNGSSQTVKLNDHHIFPVKGAAKVGQSSKEIRSTKEHILNSPLNRTLISSVANSKINDMKPEDYLKEVSDIAKIKHCIPRQSFQQYSTITANANGVYEAVLKFRFDEIKNKVLLELDTLKEKVEELYLSL